MPGGQYIYLGIASFLISVFVQLHWKCHENIIVFVVREVLVERYWGVSNRL